MMEVLAGEHVKPDGRAENLKIVRYACVKILNGLTYPLSLACADVVWQAVAVVWVTHKDGGLDGGECGAGQGSTCSTADGVVHDLTTLVIVSVVFLNCNRIANLAVSDEDNLGGWALLIVGGNGLNDGSRSLGG
jgi:hypothetical protein